MFRIGCHLSSSKGFLAMGRQAVSIGADTFQYFSRNPRGSAVKETDPADVKAYLQYAEEHRLSPPLVHAPYTLNACSANPDLRAFARDTMIDDLRRLRVIPGAMYNFHPGSHVGQGIEEGIRAIAETLTALLEKEGHSTVLLETMAGKGSEVGSRFEEIRAIMDQTAGGERLGVCLDTCHVYDAGYDIVERLDDVLEELDRIVGLSHLRAVHINDSKNPFGSHKDRHEKIGDGSLGIEALSRIINHPALRNLPFYLETPNEVEGYGKEIALLRTYYRPDEQ